jgi:hypothetical protein
MKEVADVIRWAARDLIFNLEALPEEKRDWQPAPGTKSALTVAGEAAGVIENTLVLLQGGEASWGGYPHPETLEEARRLVVDVADRYAAALVTMDPASLERTLHLPFGNFRAARFALMPMIELIHHRGQICYLQSLLGDTQVRFDPAAAPILFGPPPG